MQRRQGCWLPRESRSWQDGGGRDISLADYPYPAPLVRFVAAINEPWRQCLVSRNSPRGLAGSHVIPGDGLPRLDLNGLQACADFKNQIGLQSIVVAPEIQIGWPAKVETTLDELGNDPCFE